MSAATVGTALHKLVVVIVERAFSTRNVQNSAGLVQRYLALVATRLDRPGDGQQTWVSHQMRM